MKVAFITNLPSHFHTRLFETIAQHFDTDFLFFSDGSEAWIDDKSELKFGDYRGRYVHGIRLNSHFRINLGLVLQLLRGKYDVIVQSVNGRFELAASFLIARLLRKPFILWTNLWFHPKTLFHLLSFPVTRYIYRHSNAIVVYGDHVRDYLMALGVEKEKIFYSWNVTDNDVFNKPVPTGILEDLRTKYNLHGRRPILFVGRLSEEKGLMYLLEAFKDLPAGLKATLLLVGDGSEKDSLVDYVEKHRMEHVHFVGYVPNRKLVPFYALSDILVVPSVATRTLKEVWGIVINEAMNQGCPVIATDSVGAAVGGLVQEGKSGLVVPERNSLVLQDAIIRLLAEPKKLGEMKAYAKNAIQEWDHHKSFKGFQEAIEFVSTKSGRAMQNNR